MKLWEVRGPGTWKFNNSLLEDNDFKELIAFIYPQIHDKYSDVNDKQLTWELIKMEVRAKSIKFTKQKISKLNKREFVLQRKLQELDYIICNANFDNLDWQQIFDNYESAKEELKRIFKQMGKEATFRSKVKWLEKGEWPTKYFFNLAKNNYEKKLVREVKPVNNGEVKSQRNDIEKKLENFYSDMYTSRVDVTEWVEEGRSFECFIDSFDIPKLSDEDQELLEKDLTLEEL